MEHRHGAMASCWRAKLLHWDAGAADWGGRAESRGSQGGKEPERRRGDESRRWPSNWADRRRRRERAKRGLQQESRGLAGAEEHGDEKGQPHRRPSGPSRPSRNEWPMMLLCCVVFACSGACVRWCLRGCWPAGWPERVAAVAGPDAGQRLLRPTFACAVGEAGAVGCWLGGCDAEMARES